MPLMETTANKRCGFSPHPRVAPMASAISRLSTPAAPIPSAKSGCNHPATCMCAAVADCCCGSSPLGKRLHQRSSWADVSYVTTPCDLLPRSALVVCLTFLLSVATGKKFLCRIRLTFNLA